MNLKSEYLVIEQLNKRLYERILAASFPRSITYLHSSDSTINFTTTNLDVHKTLRSLISHITPRRFVCRRVWQSRCHYCRREP
jgi:hypothetical protein